MGAVDVVVRVVLLALRLRRLRVGQIPHVEPLRGLCAESLLQVVGYLVRIHEVHVHALGHVARSHAVESVGVDERVALHHPHAVLKRLRAQLLVVVVLRRVDEEVPPHHAVHQHRYAALLARLAHVAGQHVVERRAGVGMAVLRGLLVVVAELDDHVVAGLHLLEHLRPAPLVEERERRAPVHGVVVNADVVVEVALQRHPPPSLQLAFRQVFLGSRRVADDEDRCLFLICRSRQHDDQGCQDSQ